MKSIKKSGFSLIELMVVVIVIAIIVTVAIPSYQAYMRRASMNQAQQEMQRLALLLDKHKAKNFTYRGFDIKTMTLPVNAAARQDVSAYTCSERLYYYRNSCAVPAF